VASAGQQGECATIFAIIVSYFVTALAQGRRHWRQSGHETALLLILIFGSVDGNAQSRRLSDNIRYEKEVGSGTLE
jgi:hypothetical protein